MLVLLRKKMNNKDKDFFENILDDVTPLRKKNTTQKITTNLKKTIILKKTKNKNQKNKPTIQTKTPPKQKATKEKAPEQNTRFFRDIKKKKIKIEKKIDLHGCTLLEAEKKFDEEVELSFQKQQRCVLFITGKGNRYFKNEEISSKLYYGKIREKIRNWIYKTNNKKKILYFSEAAPQHGGAGSVYVYLRKQKN